jgi:hydrogenase nickel incorporation protein HypA/HybF
MLESVQAESARHNAHVLAVGVKIGELSGVDSESLRFCFEALVRDTDLAPLALEIERLPWRNRCRRCAWDFAVENYRTECPQCGSADTVRVPSNAESFLWRGAWRVAASRGLIGGAA